VTPRFEVKRRVQHSSPEVSTRRYR
jgi:hypothetical protein